MHQVLQQRLDRLCKHNGKGLLTGGKKGIEKESLRVTADGTIAQTPHPRGLGSALTHPCITTDYSEALLEFITPPMTDVGAVYDYLSHIHRFVYEKLDGEILWATSMPCVIEGESSIPIAYYGESNVGKMKHVYRRGLGYRYGRTMQAIAGVHFNYSLPEHFWPVFREMQGDSRPDREFRSDSYFCLIRNFQRLGWLVPYLFGTSPAVCKSFLPDRSSGLADFDRNTYFGRNATSLRMSDIGYKNKAQDGLNISYNNVEEYVQGLTRAIETPFPEYMRTGVVVDGEYLQLNANILQIENEYYSFVRPKQVTRSGEKPTLALARRGVQYVEIRVLDVNSYDPVGISRDQMRFMETFLILCLLQDSPPVSMEERKQIDYNQQMVTCCGRDPDLRLTRNGSEVPLRQWAREICELMKPIAELLDQGESAPHYVLAVQDALSVVADSDCTPSARVLQDMRDNKQPFFHFAMSMCEKYSGYFKSMKLPADRLEFFEQAARESLAGQKAIEDADEISFDEYLRRYFAQS